MDFRNTGLPQLRIAAATVVPSGTETVVLSMVSVINVLNESVMEDTAQRESTAFAS
jgi:hypothetical protein